jgi:hypothetical protein
MTLPLPTIETIARAMYRHRIEELRIYLDRFELYDEAVERGWRCCESEAKAVLDAIATHSIPRSRGAGNE